MISIDKFRNGYIRRTLFRLICRLRCSELYIDNIGHNVKFPHGLKNIVLHPQTLVENNVTIYHQVTCGRGDMWNVMKGAPPSEFKGIVLKKGAVICVGAKIICNKGLLVVGENTIIGANAVLTKSTGSNEIWVGVPAKKIGTHNYGEIN